MKKISGSFKKKPVVIQALEWTGKNQREMYEFLEGKTPNDQMESYGQNFRIAHNVAVGGLLIKTLEGELIASIGDIIIKGVHGEFYPCKPEIFEKTYEKVD